MPCALRWSPVTGAALLGPTGGLRGGLAARPAGGTSPGTEVGPHRDTRGRGAGLVLILGTLGGPVRFHSRLKAAWRSPERWAAVAAVLPKALSPAPPPFQDHWAEGSREMQSFVTQIALQMDN